MISFFATCGRSKQAGSWQECTTWAITEIQAGRGPVKILKARAGEPYAYVVAEITAEGVRRIQGGRFVKIGVLRT